MGEHQERAVFDRRHASEPIEITILTGESVGGAGKAGGDELWTPSADLLAYVDEFGDVVAASGRLSWLATEEQRDSWIHGLQRLQQYTVRVRRATPDPEEYAKHGMEVPDLSHHFALDGVLVRDLHIPALNERLELWLLPVEISTHAGTFALERGMGWFAGAVDWCGHEVMVTLAIDDEVGEGAETCELALDRFLEISAHAAECDLRWRAFAATKLTDLANDWADQEAADEGSGPEPILAEHFATRIRLSELSVGADGSVTAYYSDDDLFWGHAILIEVAPDGTLTDASIAG